MYTGKAKNDRRNFRGTILKISWISKIDREKERKRERKEREKWREKREKRERKERKKREKEKNRERNREKKREEERKRCPGSIIINLHSILKKKN